MYAYHPEVAHRIEMEHLQDFRREADQARLVRKARSAENTRIRISHIIRLVWARLSRGPMPAIGVEPRPRRAWQD